MELEPVPEEQQPKKQYPEFLDPKTGKFLPGNKAGVGKQPGLVGYRNKLHAAFLSYVGTDRLTQAMEKHLEAIQNAKGKELEPLLRLLYEYCLGKAQANVAIDVTHNEQPAPITLDSADIAALERMRLKLSNPTIQVDTAPQLPSSKSDS
jgi:hypothetical protein